MIKEITVDQFLSLVKEDRKLGLEVSKNMECLMLKSETERFHMAHQVAICGSTEERKNLIAHGEVILSMPYQLSKHSSITTTVDKLIGGNELDKDVQQQLRNIRRKRNMNLLRIAAD